MRDWNCYTPSLRRKQGEIDAVLSHRAIQLVSDTVNQIPLDEEKAKTISELIEALIPLGDKIYFLGHDASVFNNKELGKAEEAEGTLTTRY